MHQTHNNTQDTSLFLNPGTPPNSNADRIYREHMLRCVTYLSYFIVLLGAAFWMVTTAWFHIMEGVSMQVDKINHHISGLTDKLDDIYKGRCVDIICSHYLNPALDMANQVGYNSNY